QAPGRFVPMLVVPFWDVAGAVEEIDRMGGNGFGGIITTGAPHLHGMPLLGNEHWDPMWQACVNGGLSVSFHIGNGKTGDSFSAERMALERPPTTVARVATTGMVENAKQVTELLLSGVLQRFPALKFVSVESGLGWVPFVLECLDYHIKKTTRGRDREWS